MLIKPRTEQGLAIVNRWGSIWTDKVFDTPEAAISYLKSFFTKIDPTEWSLVPATLTVAADSDTTVTQAERVPVSAYT